MHFISLLNKMLFIYMRCELIYKHYICPGFQDTHPNVCKGKPAFTTELSKLFMRKYSSAVPCPLSLFTMSVFPRGRIYHFSFLLTFHDISLTFTLCWDDLVRRNIFRFSRQFLGVTGTLPPTADSNRFVILCPPQSLFLVLEVGKS